VCEECEPDLASADPGPPAERCLKVRMPAEIDIANADDLRQSLTAAVDRGFAVVIADMSDTLFCDCAAVTALVSAGQYAALPARSSGLSQPPARSCAPSSSPESPGCSRSSRVLRRLPVGLPTRKCGMQASAVSPRSALAAELITVDPALNNVSRDLPELPVGVL
jgi:STAS domain